MIPTEEAATNNSGVRLGQCQPIQSFMKSSDADATLAVSLTVTLSLHRPALRWSAGSCSVMLGCWREEPALS